MNEEVFDVIDVIRYANPGISPEQLLIRKECYRKRREMCDLIKEEKWDLIQDCDCVKDCELCNPINRIMMPKFCSLNYILMFCKDMKEEVQKTIERINGEITKEKWFYSIICNIPPSIKNLSYFIENKLIDPNNGSEELTLLSLYSMNNTSSWESTIEYLLSQEVNINLQNEYGENIILTILRWDYYDKEDFYEDERQDKYILKFNERLIFLLEKGADPLLTDKKGISALEYAYNLKTFSQDVKANLIRILEMYI
jgi:hypothetical protein